MNERSTQKVRVLLTEDDAAISFAVRDYLEAFGYEVEAVTTCRAAAEALKRGVPDLVLLDYSLPDGTAFELIPKIRAVDANVPIIVLTAHASIDLAVDAIKEGADQFLTKPIELNALKVIIERLVEGQRLRRKQVARRNSGLFDPFIGGSDEIARLRAQVERVAASDRPILINGETGSGKGVLARWIHANGNRAEEAFVDLNCAGLSREFLESELFGHERGAFTGAVSAKQGLFEVAHRGTIFLDEIGDVDAAVQPKLLKVVEEKRFRRMGEVRDRVSDVRVIAATHVDLAKAIAENRFRRDLFFRISAFEVTIPLLRARREDVAPLAEEILRAYSAETGRPPIALGDAARKRLTEYAWPGNVRELRNVLERAALFCEAKELAAADLQLVASGGRTDDGRDDLTLGEVVRRHILRAVELEQGNVGRAATRLGIPRSTLYQKLREFETASPDSGKQ